MTDKLEQAVVAVVGLGYVGLPLALALGAQGPTLGFDIDAGRVAELRTGFDRNHESPATEFQAARALRLVDELGALAAASTYIIAVPTPVNAAKRPDLEPLRQASALVGRVLKRGDLVIYESTVYPGCTEEVCVPLLEAASGLALGRDFAVGYSPERINPGDPERGLRQVVKIVSGSDEAATARVAQLYAAIVPAGVYRAPSIKVAEAAKAIENTQRDVNIALVNECALMLDRLGIDSREVLAAARSKWNFLPFTPGLVGGHCIGVDPYYLIHKSAEVGFHPELVSAARRINDGMHLEVRDRVVKLMAARGLLTPGARVLILGLSFKEDCADVRNSRVVELAAALAEFALSVEIHDPVADAALRAGPGFVRVDSPAEGAYAALVLAVAHAPLRTLTPVAWRRWLKPGAPVFDVRAAWPRDAIDGRL